MKRTLYAMSLGVLLGLGAVIVHELLQDAEFQTTVRESVSSIHSMMKNRQSKKTDTNIEDWVLETGDPQVNQEWVQSQWEAVLN